MNAKHIYFVPMAQDDPQGKPSSMVAKFELIPKAVEEAYLRQQIQPIYVQAGK